MEQQGNYNSREAQEVRQRSEFLKRVMDFAQYMQKGYIEPSDGEMSLIISAGDATLDDGHTGRTQCMMGQHFEIVAGLADMMSDKDWQPAFRMARRMADDFGDIDDRRRELRGKQRRLRIVTAVCVLWAVVLAVMLVLDIVMGHGPLTTITSLLLMAFVFLNLYPQWRDLRRERSRLSDDEQDQRRNRIDREVAQAMQRFFSRFSREQGEDE